MSSKGKRISVIVAGATGGLGREIVSRLVSHPDVSRVVALARYPVPVNRWTSLFPDLHIGDARRYLSVVPIDWEKILADAAHIPRSYVSDGVWRFDDAEAEWKSFQRHCRRAARSARASNDADAALRYETTGQGAGSDLPTMTSSSVWLSGPPQGYIKLPAGWSDDGGYGPNANSYASRARDIIAELHDHEKRAISLSSTFDPSLASGDAHNKGGHAADTERRRRSQEFLRQFLQNSFYRSVFSGHQVAINCVGTSHVFSSAELTLVDFDLSMAFAKIVRLFNCMAHAEPTEDEERLLVEATSRELDSVLWNEIYAACYGKTDAPEHRATFAKEPEADDDDTTRGSLRRSRRRRQAADDDNTSFAIADTSSKREEKVNWMNRGQVATLRHFSQISVRGANERSPVAYLRTHGKRDRDLLVLFNRWKGAKRFAAGKHEFRKSLSRFSTHVGRRSLLQWLNRVLFGRAASGASSTGDTRDPCAHLGCHGTRFGALANADGEQIARERAQMLLRRDVVKIWEQSNLTIWRPGVFMRRGRRRRFVERLFSFLERPVDVKCLAECVVDDIVDSFYNDSSRANESDRSSSGDSNNAEVPCVGKTKIINGSSVARRTHMKALEDGLDERDTQHLQRMKR